MLEYCRENAKTVEESSTVCHNSQCITSTEDIALSSKHKMDLSGSVSSIQKSKNVSNMAIVLYVESNTVISK